MSSIDWTKVRDFLEVAGMAGSAMFVIGMLWMRDKFVTRKTFDETVLRIDKRIDESETSVSKEISGVRLEVATIGERTSSTKETVEAVRDTVTRIDDFLRGRSAA